MSDIHYTCRPATDDETAITAARLRDHTEASIGMPVKFEPFGVTAYEGDKLIGSIIGKIFSHWLHMDLVWVDKSYRGKGIGRQLLKTTIAEASRKGLGGIEVWTQSWQSPGFYLACGFSELAVIDDFLPNQKRHVLRHVFERSAA